MSSKRGLALGLVLACTTATPALATTREAQASCRAATQLKSGSMLRFGPVTVVGFNNYRCAAVTLGCGPKAGGYQAALALELSQKLVSPIVLRATSRSGTARLVLVANRTPAPNVPRCMSGHPLRSSVTLRAPYMYFVLFVFVPKDDSFQLTALRHGRELGSALIAAQRAR